MKSMTRAQRTEDDNSLLNAALMGYQRQREEIDGKIENLQRRLGKSGRRTAAAKSAQSQPVKKHHISPEGLKRIRDAQKRRWKAAKAKTAAAGS
jgi:hypothetical protein